MRWHRKTNPAKRMGSNRSNLAGGTSACITALIDLQEVGMDVKRQSAETQLSHDRITAARDAGSEVIKTIEVQTRTVQSNQNNISQKHQRSLNNKDTSIDTK